MCLKLDILLQLLLTQVLLVYKWRLKPVFIDSFYREDFFWLILFFNDPHEQGSDSVCVMFFYIRGVGCLMVFKVYSSSLWTGVSVKCPIISLSHQQWSLSQTHVLWPFIPGSEERKDPWLLTLCRRRCFCALGINSLSSDGRAITESRINSPCF